METNNIYGVEIFATGKWNGDPFTQSDLEGIAEAFQATKDALKPFLKIGHSKTQNLLERDSLPAAGWLDNVRVVGSKLLADFKRVPKKIYDLITAGAYRRVSSELFIDFKHGGKTWPLALKAVSILGGETPAVETLDDIIALYGLDVAAVPLTFDAKAEVRVLDFSKTPKTEETKVNELEIAKAALVEADKKLSAANARIADITSEGETIKAENEALKVSSTEAVVKLNASNEKLAVVEKERKFARLTSAVDKLIVDKKIVPAQKEKAFALLEMASGVEALKFKAGDKEYTAESLVLEFINSGDAKVPNTQVQSEAGESSSEDGIVKAQNYARDNKVSLKEAMLHLAREAEPKTVEAEDEE